MELFVTFGQVFMWQTDFFVGVSNLDMQIMEYQENGMAFQKDVSE